MIYDCFTFFNELELLELRLHELADVVDKVVLVEAAKTHSNQPKSLHHASKWFAAVEMIRLAADKDWLHKATKEISKYWRFKRERRIYPPDAKAGFGPAPASNQTVFPERSEHCP